MAYRKNNTMTYKSKFSIFWILACISICVSVSLGAVSKSFHAVGPSEPVVEYLAEPSSPVPGELERVAIEVHFDLVPTMMRFSMPCFPSMVTENGIHFSNGWTETYDPKASSSCEILWDRKAQYSRMWIESQNPARIVVRWRAAIADPQGKIAHTEIPSGSPYGKGDWTDEWYYIYPDGTHTRFVRIYTGLAAQSLAVTDQLFDGLQPVREIPPNVIHEFQEDFIFGLANHKPTDDIKTSPKTLIMLDGRTKTISYKPYPKDFGEFALAPIKVINLKSRFRPFTIFIPHGIENEPYPHEGELPHVVQTWMKDGGREGYSASLGHTLNWWHYRRTDKILEQVYLSGMTDSKNPADTLLPLAKSWLNPPGLHMEGVEPQYNVLIYDPSQRAYIVPRKKSGPEVIEFKLDAYREEEESGAKAPVCIANPTFVVKDWGSSQVKITMNGQLLPQGRDLRVGYEQTQSGTDLIVWISHQTNEATSFKIEADS